MNVDVLIYVNTLKEFFKKDEQAFIDMFGTLKVDKEAYFQRLTTIATKNFETNGEPTLSTTQMFDIVKELGPTSTEVKELTFLLQNQPHNLFVYFNKDFPPYCLN
jgi:hypothetical protein